MPFRAIGWIGFAFFGAGLLTILFGPPEWRSYGCGALLTAVTIYVVGAVYVIRRIRQVQKATNEMMRRVMEEMNRKGQG
jgi:uncharacterized membrane protein YqjE